MDIIRREIVDADAVAHYRAAGSLLATAKNSRSSPSTAWATIISDLDYCKKPRRRRDHHPERECSLSVAEHAFTLMLTLAKNIIPVSNEYREVGFAAKNHAPLALK